MSVPGCACSSHPEELGALPGDPLPWLPASCRRAGQRRDRDLWRMLQAGQDAAPISEHGAPALPCPFLAWGVPQFLFQAGGPGTSPQKGLVASRAGSGTGLPLDWDRVLAYPCLSSQEGSRKVLSHAGTAQSRVGAQGVRAGAGSIHISLLPVPEVPQQHRLLQGCCVGSNPVWGMCCCWRSLPQCPHGLPCAVGQCPQCAALAARAQETWLGGRWGLTVSPSSSCNAAGRSTWS